jgi:small subunit ribosomal protein S27Ae
MADTPSGVWDNYDVDGDELKRNFQWSPKMGEGWRMADHKDRQTCGKTGYTEFKTSE